MAAPEWPDALAKDVARCAKKHKAASTAAAEGVDRVLEALQQARAGAAAGQDAAAVAQLRARLAEAGEASSAAVGEAAKELTAVVGKLGKARVGASERASAISRRVRARAERPLTATPWRLRCGRRLRSTLRSTSAAPGGSAPSTRPRSSRCASRRAVRCRTPPTRPPRPQVIARHLFRDGRFDVAELYCSETGAAVPEELKARRARRILAAHAACAHAALLLQAPFAEMHKVVAALRAHDVQPALEWARANREALSRAAEAGAASSMEWQLHRLRFLTLLQKARAGSACAGGARPSQSPAAQESRAAALQYAREHFGRFSATAQVCRFSDGCFTNAAFALTRRASRLIAQAADVQRLMGCLLFAERFSDSPYAVRGGARPSRHAAR